jgi:hypothetical protein
MSGRFEESLTLVITIGKIVRCGPLSPNVLLYLGSSEYGDSFYW